MDNVLLRHASVFIFKCDKCWILNIIIQYIYTLLLFFWIVIVAKFVGHVETSVLNSSVATAEEEYAPPSAPCPSQFFSYVSAWQP